MSATVTNVGNLDRPCLSACRGMADQKFAQVLNNVLLELSSSEKSKQAAASAAVAVLLTEAPEGQTLSPSVVPAVLPLLGSDNPLIQVSVSCFFRPTRCNLKPGCPSAASVAEKCLCGTDSCCRAGGSNTSSRAASMEPSGKQASQRTE